MRLNHCVHGNTFDKQRKTREKKLHYMFCVHSLLNLAYMLLIYVCVCMHSLIHSLQNVFFLMTSFPFKYWGYKQINKQTSSFTVRHVFTPLRTRRRRKRCFGKLDIAIDFVNPKDISIRWYLEAWNRFPANKSTKQESKRGLFDLFNLNRGRSAIQSQKNNTIDTVK